jgi:hypothetical protein
LKESSEFSDLVDIEALALVLGRQGQTLTDTYLKDRMTLGIPAAELLLAVEGAVRMQLGVFEDVQSIKSLLLPA